jgi:predicted ribosome quality control (RQC) complex YloA/Tae2 family protein
MRSLVVAILSALLCAGAAAQDKIYQVRLPDGRTLFTDRPPPGSKIISEREVPPPSPDTPARPPQGDAASSLQQQATDAQARMRQRSEEVDRAFAAVQSAERELEQAKQALEQGRAPQSGEMIATARGRVRQGPGYQDRMAELEKGVAAAEQKLARAREDLNAVR